MKRFLIIQTAFIGDVILATPVIRALKEKYPDALIDMLVRKGNEGLLDNNPNVNQLLIFNKKAKRIPEMFRIIREIRSKKYTEIITIHRYLSSGLMTVFGGAKFTTGFQNNPMSWAFSKRIKHEIGTGKHEVERNLELIAHHTTTLNIRPELFPSKADAETIQQYVDESFYCLAPASVWFTKQLPEEKWIELAITLSKSGKVYLIGGPGDKDLCARICIAAGLNEANNLAGLLSLHQSAALLARSKRAYVNDSGPMHLASAVNAPTTAFFCATIPAFGFGPLAEDSEIKEVQEKLACRPCGLHGGKTCPEGHFKCGDIDVKT